MGDGSNEHYGIPEQGKSPDSPGDRRQRVWIAMALAQGTEILFLDEPTTYLGYPISD